MNWPVALFLLAAFATIFCTAVNCYTLRLAYPLWRWVGRAEFGELHKAYLRLLGPVITFPHIVMFFSSAALVRWRPIGFSRAQALLLFLLDALVVAVSAFSAGPIHSRFERQRAPDEPGLRRLIRISALRSVLMLVASGLVCWRLLKALSALDQLVTQIRSF